ncbi:MAG: hypothetical protein F7C34_04800 [Desulfurococcales archaeon]|nr:hypothetical protein [Desulfurococcales archaeon]
MRVVVGSGDCRVTLIVCDQCIPKILDDGVQVPRALLDLDTRVSLAGENIAGLLLSRVVGGEPLREMIERYRLRVAAEELLGLYSAVDGMISEMLLSPLYAPARRSWLLGDPYWGLFHASSEQVLQEYEDLLEKSGILVGGKVNREAARSTYARYKLQARRILSVASLRLGRIARRLVATVLPAIKRIACPAPRYDASSLVALPEGSYYEDGLDEVLSKLFGKHECRRPSILSSSYVCSTTRGQVVVKRYAAREAKWLPASMASPPGAKMIVSAPTRLATEYVMLRRIRRVLPTPRIIAVIRSSGGPIMVREYLEGEPILDSRDPALWETAGCALAKLHRAGIALIDSNPGNMLFTGDTIAIIDAEQASPFTPEAGAWDLVVFTAYSILFSVDKSLILSALHGYKKCGPDLLRKLLPLVESGRITGRLKLLAYPLYSQTISILRLLEES